RRLEFPAPPKDMRYSYPAIAGRPATLLLIWPVRDPLRAAERRELALLAAVLKDRLRVQIREEKGATYSPEATFAWSDTYPGLADLRCQLDVPVRQARKVMDQVRDLALEL